jgi:Flp pilus assembly protein TadB
VRVRLLVVLACVPFVFVAAWFADAVVHDDICLNSTAHEGDGVRGVQRWLPPRTDCEITGQAGKRVEPGESRWSQSVLFGCLMLAVVAVMSRLRVFARVAVVTAALIAALVSPFFT